MLGGAKVSNFETLDPDVTLIVNREDAGSGGRREMRCVQDCCFSWIASKDDEAVARISGCIDVYELFVDSCTDVDGGACASFVHGVLDRAQKIAFLESLTDEEFVRDPRFADPWSSGR